MSIDDLFRDIEDLDEEIAERTAIRDGLQRIYDKYDEGHDKCRKEIQKFRKEFPNYPKPNIC